MFTSMRKIFGRLGIAAALAISMGGLAHATFLDGFLVGNTQNTLNDNSLEGFVDRSVTGTPDGVFGVGDVVVGYLHIEQRIQPGNQSAGNNVYVAFSQQVVATSVVGTATIVTFAPTTVAGLTMADITGIGGLSANTMVAVYSAPGAGFSVDLTSGTLPPDAVAPLGTVTLADYFAFLRTNGTLELTGGIVDGNDFFAARAADADAAAGVQLPTTGQIAASDSTVNIATYGAALSIILNNTVFSFGNLNTVFEGIFGTGQIIVSGPGSVLGGAGTTPFNAFNVAGLIANQQCGSPTATVVCGFTDNQNIVLAPVTRVPEPSSMILFGLGLAALGIYGRRFGKSRKD